MDIDDAVDSNVVMAVSIAFLKSWRTELKLNTIKNNHEKNAAERIIWRR